MTDLADQRQDEVRELTRLAFAELGNATTGIGKVHSAIADRVFSTLRLGLGEFVTPTQIVHDAIAGGTYATISTVCDTASDLASQGANGWGRPPSQTTKGALVISAITGIIGDKLHDERSPLAEEMSVRVNGVAIPPTAQALEDAFPDATTRIVVFLHGLVETEAAWTLTGAPTYGARLREDIGATEIQVRYNSGKHISENGRDLERLMSKLVANWPVPVLNIAFVGHSMGGLVVRSACFRAATDERWWVRQVRHIVTLGTPHLGAPLEQSVHYLSAVLNALPETRPFARLLRRRSSGVRDLFHGSLVDEDWSSRTDFDAWKVDDIQEVPLLENVTHCFVSAVITKDARHPFGRIIGDGLVLIPSASGRNNKRHIGFRDEDGFAITSAHHFTLLNHPGVYDWLVGRLWG